MAQGLCWGHPDKPPWDLYQKSRPELFPGACSTAQAPRPTITDRNLSAFYLVASSSRCGPKVAELRAQPQKATGLAPRCMPGGSSERLTPYFNLITTVVEWFLIPYKHYTFKYESKRLKLSGTPDFWTWKMLSYPAIHSYKILRTGTSQLLIKMHPWNLPVSHLCAMPSQPYQSSFRTSVSLTITLLSVILLLSSIKNKVRYPFRLSYFQL